MVSVISVSPAQIGTTALIATNPQKRSIQDIGLLQSTKRWMVQSPYAVNPNIMVFTVMAHTVVPRDTALGSPVLDTSVLSVPISIFALAAKLLQQTHITRPIQ